MTAATKPVSQIDGKKASVSLYRKYRPTALSDVIGQEGIITALTNALENRNFRHAYLFVGPRGTGKTSVARIFAHAVNNFDYQIEDNYLDIIEMDAASNRSIDDIREIKERAIIAPTEGNYKVYIIDEVHMLTREANNALLKTIEEPPEHVIFILATTNIEKIPATILSRAQVYNFQLANADTMLAHLRKISDLEGIKITDEALKIVVRMGGGSFRDSLSILDQVATLSSAEITPEIIESAMGLPSQQSIAQLLEAYRDKNTDSVRNTLQSLYNSGLTAERIASGLITEVCEHPEPQFLPLLAKLPEVLEPFANAKLLLALLDFNYSGGVFDSLNSSKAAEAHARADRLVAKAKALPKPTSKLDTPQNASNESKTNLTSDSSTPVRPHRPRGKSIKEILANARHNQTQESLMTALEAPESASKSAQPSDSTSSEKTAKIAPDAPKSQSAPQVKPIFTDLVKDFDWDRFIEEIKSTSVGTYYQLRDKVSHSLESNTLHLYPRQKITRRLLETPENIQLMTALLGGATIIIHSPEEAPVANSTTKNSPRLAQISDIMGSIQEANEGDIPEF